MNLISDEFEEDEDEDEEIGGVWTIGAIDVIADSMPGVPGGYGPPGICCATVSKDDGSTRKEERPKWKSLVGKTDAVETIALRNKFDVLAEGDVDHVGDICEVNVQETIDITVDSDASKSVWPVKKKGVQRCKKVNTVKLAAANGSPIHVEGEAKLTFHRAGRKCTMNFLDADVKKPLAAVSAIVDEGNTVVFGAKGSYIENDITRIPMVRKHGVYVIKLDVDKDAAKCQKRVVDMMQEGGHLCGICGSGDVISADQMGEHRAAVFNWRV